MVTNMRKEYQSGQFYASDQGALGISRRKLGMACLVRNSSHTRQLPGVAGHAAEPASRQLVDSCSVRASGSQWVTAGFAWFGTLSQGTISPLDSLLLYVAGSLKLLVRVARARARPRHPRQRKLREGSHFKSLRLGFPVRLTAPTGQRPDTSRRSEIAKVGGQQRGQKLPSPCVFNEIECCGGM